MIDLIKKTLLAGVGAAIVTKEKAEQVLQEYVQQGKVSAADARAMAERIAEQGRKEFDDMSTQLNAKIHEFTAGKDASFQARLVALELRVQALETQAGPTNPPAGQP